MAKLKTKKLSMDTTANEILIGVWQFETSKYRWQWRLTKMGVNLSFVQKDKDDEYLSGLIFAKDLDSAVMYAWGFDGGVDHARAVIETFPKDFLARVVEAEDLDGVMYHLAQVAVAKRNAATDNKAEEDYWQAAISILHDAEEKVSAL